MNGTVKTEQSILRRLLINPFRIGPMAGTLAHFYDQFAALLRAGLPIVRVFDILEEQCGGGRIRRAILRMKQHIEDGGNIGSAFAMFSHLFGPAHVATIRAGEQAGRLTEVVEGLSVQCKQTSALVKFIIGSMLYSTFLLHMTMFVVPFVQLISHEDPKPSYLSLLLPKLGLLYGVALFLVIVPRVMKQFTTSAYVLDLLKEWVPMYAGVAEKSAIARFAATLAALYDSGITLSEALPVAADTCGNEVLRRRAHKVARLVDKGEPLTRAIETAGGFPRTLINMIATGEESGQLSEMLGNSAELYAGQARSELKRMLVVLAAVLFLSVAVYAAYEIISFYSALFKNRYEGIEELRR